ncbi:MAG: hypothetical protein PVF85_01215 [Anaerolineales bacterium]
MNAAASPPDWVGPALPQDGHARRLLLIRLILGVTFILGALAVNAQRQYADEIAVWAVSSGWRWAIWIGGVLTAVFGLIFGSSWTSIGNFYIRLSDTLIGLATKLGILRPLVIAALSMVFPYLVLGPYGRFVFPFFTRLLIFWLLTITASWLASTLRPSANPLFVSAAIALVFAALHRVAVFSADISVYPFSLGWSEASRYYYASLFLSKRIYGVSIPPSVLHPTRYLIQSIPFLAPGAGLFIHRLWQVVVWVLLTAVTGIALSSRLRLQNRRAQWLLAVWAFLFIFQGPVWYHLLIMVALLLWGVQSERRWLTLAVVLLASAWAGVSRVNWIPVPGMLAGLIYLLERKRSNRGVIGYFAWPLAWFVAGTALGFISQWTYIAISGNEASRFASSLSSPLLWYRLLPSATFALGVLPGILLASLPLVFVIAFRLVRIGERTEWLRTTAILAVLLILFGGGILVSVKIGGGSNLHNLDAFLIALMITGVYAGTSRWRYSSQGSQVLPTPAPLVLLALSMPICFAIGMGKPLRTYDMQRAEQSLSRVKSIVEPIAEDGGNVLLISQRHLLTFGNLVDVEMIPEYETVFLMEMAMSRNRAYLDEFHEDLEDHVFDMIVVDRLSNQIQGREHNFAEENNAWVEEVSRPILCHYNAAYSIASPPLEFYVPLKGESRCDL